MKRWFAEKRDIIWLFAGLLFYFVLACSKLTEAPLWFDEGVEFFYSKYLVGKIPGISNWDNMYERIIITYQPPLYNVLLYFWLKVAETDTWFRLSSVIMGAIGAIGLYKIIRRYASAAFSGFSVIIYSCVYQVMYFSLECSEYILMMMFLFWMIYFYCIFIERTDKKSGICFTLFAVLAMYSQYGAAFLILPLAISMVIRLWGSKQIELLKLQVGSYVCAVVFAGIPLFWFFLRPQLLNPDSTFSQRQLGTFEGGNVLYDFFYWLSTAFRWIALESQTRFAVLAALGIVVYIAFSIFYLIKGKKLILKYLFVSGSFAWIIYYIIVKTGIYAYGGYANRYNLFILPIWLVTILLTIKFGIDFFNEYIGERNKFLPAVIKYCALVCGIGYCVYGAHQINNHWDKMDCRGVADAWIEAEAWNEITFIDFNQNPAFTYYLRHDERYQEYMEDNMIRDMELHYFDHNSYRQYVLKMFDGQWPEKMYLCTGPMLKEILEAEGYMVETIHETTASLYYAYK